MSAPIKAALKGEVAFRTETMRRRLNSRCKGLLEAPTIEQLGPEAKVQYLHRTVRIQGALSSYSTVSQEAFLLRHCCGV
jgi:hypothetical protein